MFSCDGEKAQHNDKVAQGVGCVMHLKQHNHYGQSCFNNSINTKN